jgi:hypothetical protein
MENAQSIDAQVNDATSSVPGLLNRYQTTTKAMDGSFSSGTARFSRVNNTVTIHVPVSSHSSNSNPACSAGFVPADYRPSGDTRNICSFNGSRVKSIIVKSSGNLEFEYRDWAGSGAADTTTEFDSAITFIVS